MYKISMEVECLVDKNWTEPRTKTPRVRKTPYSRRHVRRDPRVKKTLDFRSNKTWGSPQDWLEHTVEPVIIPNCSYRRKPMLKVESLNDLSYNNAESLSKVGIASCYNCLNTFSTKKIKEWIDVPDEKTALCPVCGIDSVIPGNIDLEFLYKAKDFWFGGKK